MYIDKAKADGLTDEAAAILLELSRESGYQGEDDDAYDMGNYSLGPGPWQGEDHPAITAANWAADKGHEHQMLALLELRSAFGLPALA